MRAVFGAPGPLPKKEQSAALAAREIDETTRERAGYVCADFARHERLAIRGRTGRDVFALALRSA